MVSINVDGQVIDAPAGAPLVETLKNNGFYVPSLCYIDGLKPYAGCRSCLVDIEGPPGLQLSCTAIVQDGMTVRTATDEVLEARKAVLSIILANHSDRCLTCHRREHCHPGDICLRDDVVTHRAARPLVLGVRPRSLGPLVGRGGRHLAHQVAPVEAWRGAHAIDKLRIGSLGGGGRGQEPA